jgi:hypothetical protein
MSTRSSRFSGLAAILWPGPHGMHSLRDCGALLARVGGTLFALALASPLMVFLLAHALRAQDHKSDVQVKPPAQTDSVCQVRGDFPNVSQVSDCQVSLVPVPVSVLRKGGGDPISIAVGGWKGVIEAEATTGRKSVQFFLAATGDVERQATTLELRCRGGRLDAYIHSPVMATRGYARKIAVRFGAGPLETEHWLVAVDDTTFATAGDKSKAERFIRKLANVSSLTVQVTPDVSPQPIIFELAGIMVVDAQLEDACKQIAGN